MSMRLMYMISRLHLFTRLERLYLDSYRMFWRVLFRPLGVEFESAVSASPGSHCQAHSHDCQRAIGRVSS